MQLIFHFNLAADNSVTWYYLQVYGLDVGLVGQELKFSVNASQAGDGFVKVNFESAL